MAGRKKSKRPLSADNSSDEEKSKKDNNKKWIRSKTAPKKQNNHDIPW